MTENSDVLEAMMAALMEYETIDSGQVDDLMARRTVSPPKDWHDDDFNNHSGGVTDADAESDVDSNAAEDKSNPIGGPAEEH